MIATPDIGVRHINKEVSLMGATFSLDEDIIESARYLAKQNRCGCPMAQ